MQHATTHSTASRAKLSLFSNRSTRAPPSRFDLGGPSLRSPAPPTNLTTPHSYAAEAPKEGFVRRNVISTLTTAASVLSAAGAAIFIYVSKDVWAKVLGVAALVLIFYLTDMATGKFKTSCHEETMAQQVIEEAKNRGEAEMPWQKPQVTPADVPVYKTGSIFAASPTYQEQADLEVREARHRELAALTRAPFAGSSLYQEYLEFKRMKAFMREAAPPSAFAGSSMYQEDIDYQSQLPEERADAYKPVNPFAGSAMYEEVHDTNTSGPAYPEPDKGYWPLDLSSSAIAQEQEAYKRGEAVPEETGTRAWDSSEVLPPLEPKRGTDGKRINPFAASALYQEELEMSSISYDELIARDDAMSSAASTMYETFTAHPRALTPPDIRRRQAAIYASKQPADFSPRKDTYSPLAEEQAELEAMSQEELLAFTTMANPFNATALYQEQLEIEEMGPVDTTFDPNAPDELYTALNAQRAAQLAAPPLTLSPNETFEAKPLESTGKPFYSASAQEQMELEAMPAEERKSMETPPNPFLGSASFQEQEELVEASVPKEAAYAGPDTQAELYAVLDEQREKDAMQLKAMLEATQSKPIVDETPPQQLHVSTQMEQAEFGSMFPVESEAAIASTFAGSSMFQEATEQMEMDSVAYQSDSELDESDSEDELYAALTLQRDRNAAALAAVAAQVKAASSGRVGKVSNGSSSKGEDEEEDELYATLNSQRERRRTEVASQKSQEAKEVIPQVEQEVARRNSKSFYSAVESEQAEFEAMSAEEMNARQDVE